MQLGWSGSAVLGGFLLDRYSFDGTFLITASVQVRVEADPMREAPSTRAKCCSGFDMRYCVCRAMPDVPGDEVARSQKHCEEEPFAVFRIMGQDKLLASADMLLITRWQPVKPGRALLRRPSRGRCSCRCWRSCPPTRRTTPPTRCSRPTVTASWPSRARWRARPPRRRPWSARRTASRRRCCRARRWRTGRLRKTESLFLVWPPGMQP